MLNVLLFIIIFTAFAYVYVKNKERHNTKSIINDYINSSNFTLNNLYDVRIYILSLPEVEKVAISQGAGYNNVYVKTYNRISSRQEKKLHAKITEYVTRNINPMFYNRSFNLQINHKGILHGLLGSFEVDIISADEMAKRIKNKSSEISNIKKLEPINEGVNPTHYKACETNVIDTTSFKQNLKEICLKYNFLDSKNFFIAEQIPEELLNKVKLNFSIPIKEEVIAIIDTTLFGVGKNGMAICLSGVYWKNDWTVKSKNTYLSWMDFCSIEIRKKY